MKIDSSSLSLPVRSSAVCEVRRSLIRSTRLSLRCTPGISFGAAAICRLRVASWRGHCIDSFRVRYQQYADDTQLYLSMRASDSAHHLDILRACSTAVHDWYLANNLLLNADKSDVIVLGTANQLRQAASASVDSVEVAGVTLPVASTLKSLGVILDQRLTLDDYATAVAMSCKNARAIKHVRHLLPESVARTLACSLINSRLDYCNSLLHGAPESTMKKLQRAQNNAAHVVLAVNRRSDANSAPAPLVASASTRDVQDGCVDAENPYDWCPGVLVPQRASGSTRRCSPHTFCFIASANCTKTDH